MAWVPLAVMAGSMIYDQLNKDDKMSKVPTISKDQKGILNQIMQLLGQGGGIGQGQGESVNYLRQLMNPNSQAVNQFAQPYIDQFNQQTVPGLAERFAGLGANSGALQSSGFGQALGAAGGNLQTQLAALKAGLGQQAAQSLMQQYSNLAGIGLSAQPFGYQQKGPTMTGSALQGWAQSGFQGPWSNMGQTGAT